MHAAHSSGWSTCKFIWGGTKETRKFCKHQHWHVRHHRQVNCLFILLQIVQIFQIHVYVVGWTKHSPSHDPSDGLGSKSLLPGLWSCMCDCSNAFYIRTWIDLREQSVMSHYSINLALECEHYVSGFSINSWAIKELCLFLVLLPIPTCRDALLSLSWSQLIIIILS